MTVFDEMGVPAIVATAVFWSSPGVGPPKKANSALPFESTVPSTENVLAPVTVSDTGVPAAGTEPENVAVRCSSDPTSSSVASAVRLMFTGGGTWPFRTSKIWRPSCVVPWLRWISPLGLESRNAPFTPESGSS